MNSSELPILIVGAGPVGLSLGLALARKGLPVVVCEADPELNTEIRASTFHPPTLEMFAEWDVIDQFLETGHIVRKLQYLEREPRQTIAEFNYDLIAGDTDYPFRLQCPQHLATRILKPAVEQAGGRVFMEHKLTSFENASTGISATFETSSGEKTIQASYLCGADGSRSIVRSLVGIPFEGLTYEDRFLLIGTDPGASALLPPTDTATYIFDPEEWVIILNLPDLVRIVFRMAPVEHEIEALSEDSLRKRVAKFFGEEFFFAIRTIQLYKVHQRVASSFRQKSILLLGDAAHVNNPAGGMGMNSGVHDAHALAEALAAGCQNDTDSTLDHWAEERKSAAINSIQEYTYRAYKDMTITDPAERRIRNLRYGSLADDPHLAREFLLRTAMLEDRI